MKEHEKNVSSTTSKMIVVAVLTVGFYCGMTILFFRPPECLALTLYNLTGNGFSSKTPLVIIFAFNAVWFASIKFWPLNNVTIKLVLSSLLVAFTASFITSYIIANMLRDFRW